MRGFFRMDYARQGGAGGTVVFTDGNVAGWDTGGGFFRGRYDDDGQAVVGELTMDFPNGGTLVNGDAVPKGAAPLRLPFRIDDPARAESIRLETPTGPVAVKLTRVSAL
ncbi:MAG: hypothetical protein Q7T73_16230 [Beijerinckiaceae bacterium]|nr:hypothetical protein [Beijerinckiaceae bacterium]